MISRNQWSNILFGSSSTRPLLGASVLINPLYICFILLLILERQLTKHLDAQMDLGLTWMRVAVATVLNLGTNEVWSASAFLQVKRQERRAILSNEEFLYILMPHRYWGEDTLICLPFSLRDLIIFDNPRMPLVVNAQRYSLFHEHVSNDIAESVVLLVQAICCC